jgi:plasmid stability protein
MMIYLEEDQFLQLKARARETGESMAAILREALRRYLEGEKGEEDPFFFVGLASGPEGEAVSEEAEEYLRSLLRR